MVPNCHGCTPMMPDTQPLALQCLATAMTASKKIRGSSS